MNTYMGKSYLIDGEEILWTEKELLVWKETKCKEGKHLFDEVLGVESHYLYCDACGKVSYNIFQKVEKVSQLTFFIERIGKKKTFLEKLKFFRR